jgi:hypothetical protein
MLEKASGPDARLGQKKGQELAGLAIEEETAFITFMGSVPVETFQEDNAIEDH